MRILGIVLCMASFVACVTYIAVEHFDSDPMPKPVEKGFIAVTSPAAVAGVLLFLFA